MINYSNYDPVALQVTGGNAKQQINRVQEMTFSTGLNREKVKELGTDGVVGWRSLTPEVTGTLRQLENGEIDFFQALTNTTKTTITHNDFKDSAIDILTFQTGDDAVFVGTEHYPNLRTAGLSLNIADPESSLERSFSLEGEDNIVWKGDNKYVIELIKEVSSGEAGSLDIVIGSGDYANYPAPVEDPDVESGQDPIYFVRVTRVRGTESTNLEADDYTYTSGTQTFNVTAEAGDVYKLIYTASSYIAGEDPFTTVRKVGTDDLASIEADSVEIYLADTSSDNKVYRLQSVGVEISFDRSDTSEIGNPEVVQRGVRETNVTVTLGRNVENYNLESILRGVADTHGKVDARKFADDIVLIIKIYTDSTKNHFKLGYRFENLTPSTLDDTATIDEYLSRGVTLTGENFLISNVEATVNNGE